MIVVPYNIIIDNLSPAWLNNDILMLAKLIMKKTLMLIGILGFCTISYQQYQHTQLESLHSAHQQNLDTTRTDEIIKEFSGSDQHTTRPFTVKDGWEIQWKTKGKFLQIYVLNANGELVTIAANAQIPGKGSAYQPKGGTYYLDVNALGEWTIQIVKVNR